MTDLVLSSGYLAFAAQAGFLAAVEDAGLEVGGVCGTSSGALAGALWVAGLPAERVLEELTSTRPLRRVLPSARPWRGLLSMGPVIRQLRSLLPATFEELPRPFAVGVCAGREHRLVRSGPLPEAVAASCAVPGLFAPVELDLGPCSDGGFRDRTALTAWRAARGEVPVLLHLVDRSAGAAVDDDLTGVHVVRSPRSGASLWSLGDVRARFDATRREASRVLSEVPGVAGSRRTNQHPSG